MTRAAITRRWGLRDWSRRNWPLRNRPVRNRPLRNRPRRHRPPWTVQANALLAIVGIVLIRLLYFHPLGPTLSAFFLFYLSVTAAFIFLRSTLLRFLMTGFHIATTGTSIIALMLVPEELRGDPMIPVRAGLVISLGIGVIVLQWLPPTQRWLERV